MYEIRLALWRGQVHKRELRRLPATTYATCRRLGLRDQCTKPVFVPIRSMQYQAVLDGEEIVFVDGQRPTIVQLAWQHFRPDLRTDLTASVSYESVLYEPGAQAVVQRLYSEFPRALRTFEARLPVPYDNSRILQVPPERWRNHQSLPE